MTQAPHIIRLDTVDSTNTYIRNHSELWDRQFCAVITREQTGGRGRFDRKWLSEPGRDLTFSLTYLPPPGTSDISCITLLAGLAVYRALMPRCGSGLNLKWPNDIRYQNKKIGGILCELVPAPRGIVVIIGIGINVNRTTFPEELLANATSLQSVTGIDLSPDTLFDEIIGCCMELLADYRIPVDESIIREWEGASQSIGSPVRFVLHDRAEEGIFSAINTDGSLRITMRSGDIIEGYRGEVLFQDDE